MLVNSMIDDSVIELLRLMMLKLLSRGLLTRLRHGFSDKPLWRPSEEDVSPLTGAEEMTSERISSTHIDFLGMNRQRGVSQ